MTYKDYLIRLLVIARQRAGATQTTAAEGLQDTLKAVSDWENGKIKNDLFFAWYYYEFGDVLEEMNLNKQTSEMMHTIAETTLNICENTIKRDILNEKLEQTLYE